MSSSEINLAARFMLLMLVYQMGYEYFILHDQNILIEPHFFVYLLQNSQYKHVLYLIQNNSVVFSVEHSMT